MEFFRFTILLNILLIPLLTFILLRNELGLRVKVLARMKLFLSAIGIVYFIFYCTEQHQVVGMLYNLFIHDMDINGMPLKDLNGDSYLTMYIIVSVVFLISNVAIVILFSRFKKIDQLA